MNAFRRIRVAWLLTVMLGVLEAGPCLAGRPLVTEDTGTLDPGSFELEASVDYIRNSHIDRSLYGAALGLNIGLIPRLEGTIAAAALLTDPDAGHRSAGISDIVVRLKYRVIDETPSVPALMAALGTRLPAGDEDRGLGDPGVDVQALGIASKTFGPVTLTLNAGYTFVTDDRRFDVVNLNASAEARMTEAWALVAEAVGEVATRREGDDRLVLRAGTIYAVGPRVRLDAAAGFGVTRSSPDVVLTLGMTVLFGGP
jgi:hypothetical protein